MEQIEDILKKRKIKSTPNRRACMKCMKFVAIGVPFSQHTPVGDRRELMYGCKVLFIRLSTCVCVSTCLYTCAV